MNASDANQYEDTNEDFQYSSTSKRCKERTASRQFLNKENLTAVTRHAFSRLLSVNTILNLTENSPQ
jgi:hypothetical protein